MSFRNYLKLVKWFFIFGPVIFLVTGHQKFSGITWVAGFCTTLLISFCLIYFVVGKDSKCPYCKKPFSLKKTNQEVVSKERVSVLVETKTRNNDRQVTGTSEQYVPGVKTTYKVSYTCKRCGKVTYKTYTDTTPTV